MFKKVKTEHHILKEFHQFLAFIEKDPRIIRMIPGRIHRKQKKTSKESFHFSYFTQSGMKWKMNKGSTSQELFVICNQKDQNELKIFLGETFTSKFQ